jgi:hypothetical protein
VDRGAFPPTGTGWDAQKVWAPSIQQVGNRTYMFYTGVDASNNQSIGYAWTDSLFTTKIPWHRQGLPVYRADSTSWADAQGHEVTGVQQFRDPFVMPDPDHAGRFLLFNTGEDAQYPGYYAIGVARNRAGTLDRWLDQGKYVGTDHTHLSVPGAIEAPVVVRDSLTGAWRMFVANAWYIYYNSTYFRTETVGDTLTDVTAGGWPGVDSLYHYAGNDDNLLFWEACEHLQIGNVHFFAAYNGNGIGITRMHWDPTTGKFIFVHPSSIGVDPKSLPYGVRFYLAEFRGGAGVVRFGIDSPSTVTPRLMIYDLAGRAVREVTAGQPMHGRREFLWNCHDRVGQVVRSGMYFARLTGTGRAQVLRVPIVK